MSIYLGDKLVAGGLPVEIWQNGPQAVGKSNPFTTDTIPPPYESDEERSFATGYYVYSNSDSSLPTIDNYITSTVKIQCTDIRMSYGQHTDTVTSDELTLEPDGEYISIADGVAVKMRIVDNNGVGEIYIDVVSYMSGMGDTSAIEAIWFNDIKIKKVV